VRKEMISEVEYEVHEDWTRRLNPRPGFLAEFEYTEDDDVNPCYLSLDFYKEGVQVWFHGGLEASELEWRMLLTCPWEEVMLWCMKRHAANSNAEDLE